MVKTPVPAEENVAPGHMGCPGCGACLALRLALKALGKRTIMTVPACCWAVMPGVFPYCSIQIPVLFTAFETAAASASGVRAALDAKGQKDINVLAWAGDGGTLDIGIQALSGAVERRDNIIYICYDNEAYMNTGIQRSSSTPIGAWTTTTPVGQTRAWKSEPKKSGVEIMAAHRIPYTATACVSYPEDFVKKVQKAASIVGPKYLQVLSPCPAGWKSDPERSIQIGRLAVESTVWPMYEVEDGVYTVRKPAKKVSVKDYFRTQGRFRHLGEKDIEEIQKTVDAEWELLLKKETMTARK
ncbi:MAG: 3-methyl-2-oxobutanoate dehydrogenase subunit beta [Euryarchaeota archaeon]|nr:3-methyl-2-oxobutanoate dehydrogenase subunit beta [Euryarchaeota archaeon]